MTDERYDTVQKAHRRVHEATEAMDNLRFLTLHELVTSRYSEFIQDREVAIEALTKAIEALKDLD